MAYLIKKTSGEYWIIQKGTATAPNGARDVYSQVVKTGYKTLKGAEAYAKRMGFWISEKPKEAKTKRKSSTRKTTKRSCR